HTTRVQLANVLAALLRRRGAVGNTEAGFARWSGHRCRRDAFPNGKKFRSIRDDLVAKLVRQLLISLETPTQRCRCALIGVALKLINQILASVIGLFVGSVLFVK